MPSEIKSADPCPLCLLQNQVQNPLMTRPGQFYTNCKANHKFDDTEELNALRAQARAKYPMLYKGPDAPAPTDPAVFANQDIVITSEVRQTIEEVCQVKITGGPDLKGLVIAYHEENASLEAELRSARAAMSQLRARAGTKPASGSTTGASTLMSLVPEWALEGVQSQAEHAGMDAEQWILQEFTGYLENYFGAPSGRQG